jgi:TonB family protein
MTCHLNLGAIALGLAVVATGCAAPPTAEVDGAKASVDRASRSDANRYAPESLRSAEDARAALDAELKVQEGKWVKSYDRTRELAAAAKAAGEKAEADAVAGKEKGEATASRARINSVRRKPKSVAPLRVGGNVKPPTKVKDVTPVYPAIAKSANVSGAVTIEATIGLDGKVTEAKVVQSAPMFDQAALDAVKQWEYMPTLLNGVPVPVTTMVRINFARQ